MVTYNSEVDNLLYKILFEENIDLTLKRFQLPVKPTPIIEREEFSDPMFARKLQALRDTRKPITGLRHVGKNNVKKIIAKVERDYEVIV